MKKIFLFLIVTTLFFPGCKQKEARENSATAVSVKPVVYVSNYPIYYFADRIAGKTIDLRFPAANLPDPSGWNPAADTIAHMQAADLILVNGASFEHWMMNVSIPEEKVVNTSSSFSDQLLSSGTTFTHSHGGEGEHAHEGTAFTTWLNLEMAAKQAEQVKEALVKLLPENQELFESNYTRLSNDLLTLDQKFRQSLSPGLQPAIAFSHPVYQYLEAAYGIKGKSLHWEPDTPLDHDMLHEIEHLKKDHNIQYLVWEGKPLQENIDKLHEMGIKSVVIAPMGGKPDGTDFIAGMEKNLHVLKGMYGGE
jgi:zinc transport system substrate-binding protein